MSKIPFIPGSGYVGDNVVKKSENMPWWTGETLFEAFDKYLTPPDRSALEKLPLRIPIQDVYSITGVGTVPVGRVETGILRPGEKVIFEPPHVEGEVKSMEMHHQPLQEAKPGDNIGFNVRGISKTDVKRGDVAGHVDNPPTVAQSFTAQLVVLNHPTVIAPGYTPVFHAHTTRTPARITRILKKIDPRTGQVVEENPDFIKAGDAAVIEVEPLKPFVIEKYNEIPPLGRFAIRDMGMTVAVGMVIDVVAKNK